MHLTSKFQWNPKTVQIGKVISDAFETKYIASQCKYLGGMEKGDYQYQGPKVDESIFQSINSVLVDLGSKTKRQLCSISTPTVSDIPARKTFESHSQHFKASAELIADIWCIGNKK